MARIKMNRAPRASSITNNESEPDMYIPATKIREYWKLFSESQSGNPNAIKAMGDFMEKMFPQAK